MIKKFLVFLLVYCLALNSTGWSQPFIVLAYNNDSRFTQGDGKNEFSLNPNHSTHYMVKKGDSLNSILNNFYSGSGLDRRFIQLSVIIANPHAFAKSNPNFLYSQKKIYLPGKTDMENLLLGKEINNQTNKNQNNIRAQNIYFFGG